MNAEEVERLTKSIRAAMDAGNLAQALELVTQCSNHPYAVQLAIEVAKVLTREELEKLRVYNRSLLR